MENGSKGNGGAASGGDGQVEKFAPGIQLPAGVTIQHPAPPLPAEVTVALDRARKGQRFFIVIATSNENGEMQVESHRSDKFHPDWLLRAWQSVGRQIVDGRLSGGPHVVEPPKGK